MTDKDGTKRHGKGNRNPALIPVPKKLAALLQLVNLLPGIIRQPYWAVSGRNFEKLPALSHPIGQILDWRPNTQSQDSLIADQLHRRAEIPEWLRYNTPSQLWFKLSVVLEKLPLLIQAFVLNDDQGRYVDINDGRDNSAPVPMFIESDIQIEENFKVLALSENELQKIVRVSEEKINKAFSFVQNASTFYFAPDIELEGSKYVLTDAQILVPRVRQRLIFVIAAQELISCLTHPEPNKQLWKCTVVPRSEAARPRPYVNAEDGKFTLRPPILFYCLEGIEAKRVRECQICYQFFWAGRLDMKCCSTKCAHALRSRKYRLAYKEKYAYQRYRKSLKE